MLALSLLCLARVVHASKRGSVVGGGFVLTITEPRDGEVVKSPAKVKLKLVVTNGSIAEGIRSFPEEYEVCYAAVGQSRCVSILKPSERELDIPAWGIPVQIVAWLQRPSRLWKRVAHAVQVVASSPTTMKANCALDVNATVRGEYVDIETKGDVCVGVGDFFAGCSLQKRRTIFLPQFPDWKLYAWKNDCLAETIDVSTMRDDSLHYRRYGHPRGQSAAWLSDSENFTVEVTPFPRVAACLLERQVSCGNACHYFQHLAPFLTACWSFFQKYAHLRPVLVLRDGLYLGNHRWTRGLLRVMECDVVEQTIPRHAVTGRLNPGATSWDPSTPGTSRDLGWTPLSWISSSAHATELHRRLFNHTKPRRPPRGRRIRIGVLNRGIGVGGSLFDAAAVVDRLKVDHDHVDLAYFENASFEEQANWINSHDIIISPHGAQLTNLIWLEPCAAVLELYPPFYYVPGYFLTLALSVGALAYAGYPGETAEDDVARMLSGEPHAMNRFRTARIQVDDLDALANTVKNMIKDRKRCLGVSDDVLRPSKVPPAIPAISSSQVPQEECHEAGKHAEFVANTSSVVARLLEGDDEWHLCLAALGERSCFRVFDEVTKGTLVLPGWPGRHVVRVTAWLEQNDGDWISPQAIDVVACGEEDDANELDGVELRLAYPLDDSQVQNPIAAQLHFGVNAAHARTTPTSSSFDFRTFRVCYASLDQKRCSLLWPHQRAVSSEEKTALSLPQFSLPVTGGARNTRTKTATHQLSAWIEADGRRGVVVASVTNLTSV